MILDSKYQLELSAENADEKIEQTTSTLSILLFDFKAFKNEVYFIRSNYRGPDYFNILGNISDIHYLMESVITKLKNHVGGLNKVPYCTLSKSLDYPPKENKLRINSDAESIMIILIGLKNLIQSNNKAAKEAEEQQDFELASLLLEFEKEFEWSKWIFHMLSKY